MNFHGLYVPVGRSFEKGAAKQNIGFVDMLCEGPIYGLVDGKNSVFVDNISFENSTAVGSFTKPSASAMATLSSTGTTTKTYTVSGLEVRDVDVGKLAVIEVASQVLISLGPPMSVNGGTFSLGTAADGSFNANWRTLTDALKFGVLEGSSGSRYEVQINFGDGQTSIAGLYFVQNPRNLDINISDTFTLHLYQAIEIQNVTSSTVFTSTSSIVNNVTNATFYIRDKATFDSTVPGSKTDISKHDGSTLQFRRGTGDQAPIQDVSGVSAGVSITGSGAGKAIPQTDLTTLNAAGLIPFDTTGYPTGQSYADQSGAAIVIPASGPSSGPNFGLSAARRTQVDEVTLRINYNSLILYNNTNGDKEQGRGIYVFQIRTRLNGQETPYKTLFANQGGQIVHFARTTAPVSFDHTIGLNRFKPFDDFDIRIIRLSRPTGRPVRADGTSEGSIDDWSLQAESSIGGSDLTSTLHDKLYYPYTAHAAITFSSKTYNNVPSRSYHLRGMKVRIPSAYTPREETDDGIAKYDKFWNGKFKDQIFYTDNPAWVFYDIITNNRYGCGQWISPDIIDKYALFRVAKYCDELVPSGTKDSNGNDILEPRFRANIYLAKSTEVYKVLKDMATVFIGMLYWLDGKLTVVQDVPGEPVANFSKANVIDGTFSYETSGRKTRINQCVVTWNDPNNNYEPVALVVEDREAIVRDNRLISQSAVAMGATSEGQAYRYGRWKLWTAQNQKEVVSFKTGLQGAFIRPGDVINVQDRDRNAVDFSGVVKSATASAVTFDRQIEVDASNTYEITTLVTSGAAYYIGMDDIQVGGKTYSRGQRITGQVFLDADQDNNANEALALGSIDTEAKAASAFLDSTGASPIEIDWKPHSYIVTKTVTLTTANPTVAQIVGDNNYAVGDIPVAGTVWVLKANDGIEDVEGSKKEYRVLSIGLEEDGNVYEIAAAEHYNVKYDAVDKDYYLGAIPESTIDNVEPEEVPAPKNVYIVLNSDSTREGEELTVAWDVPQSLFTNLLGSVQNVNQNFKYLNNYELHHDIPNLDSPIIIADRTSHSFTGLKNDVYTFRVRAVSKKGNYSNFTSVSYTVLDIFGSDIPRVVGGLPKGIKSNSDISYSNDPTSSLPEALRFVDSSPVGFSLGSPLTGIGGVATSLRSPTNKDIDVSGISASANRERIALINNNYSDLQTWYFLHYNGATRLALWDTDTLKALPFYREIPEGGWRGSEQTWTAINNTTVSIPEKSTVMTTSNNQLANIKLLDIIRLDGGGVIKANYISSITIASTGSNNTTRLVSSGAHELVDGDKIVVEEVLNNETDDFPERANPVTGLTYGQFYVKRFSSTAVDLYLDEELTEKVQANTITGTPQSVPKGWFRKISVQAAKVVGIVNSTTFILDRAFTTAISNLSISRADYRPDYINDAIYGRVKHHSATETGSDPVVTTNLFTLETFIQLNESLTAGKLCTIDPGISAIQYSTETDGTTSQETEFTSVKVKVKAVGFTDPKFRITNVTSGANLNVTNTNGVASVISTNFVGPDSTGGNEKEFTINGDGSIDYGDGTPIIITAEVREASNAGINAFGSDDILRIKDGASGASGRVVNFIAEDYSILYDDFEQNPEFQSSSSGQIKLTATARNFSDPIFKFFENNNALNGGIYYDPSGESTSSPAQPNFNKQEISYSVPPIRGSVTTKVFEVRVAEKPQNWNASSQKGTDANGNDILPTVHAVDAFTIAHVSEGQGGPVIVNPNASHAYSTNADGSFTTSAGVPNSATTLEVILGGRVGVYVGNTTGTHGKTNGQNGLAQDGALAQGQWYIFGEPTSTTNNFSAGNITGVSNNIVSIGNVVVPTTNPQVFGSPDEQITTTIRLGTGEGTAIDLKTIQSLSKSERGAVGNNINFVFVKVPASVDASSVVAAGSSSLPNAFTVGSTSYTWSDDVPSGTGLLYASKGQLASGSSNWVWGTPYPITAKSVAELIIYTANVLTGDPPNVPTGSTFKFSDSTLTVNDSNWGLSIPGFTASGQTIYAARALVTGAGDETISIPWSTAFVFSQRIDGEAGDAVDAIFKRATGTISAPSPSAGTPTGWFTNVANVTGSGKLYMSIGTKPSGESAFTWGEPKPIEGEDGNGFAEVYAYRVRLASAPNAWDPGAAVGNTTFNFTNSTFTVPTGWSNYPSELQNEEDKLYVILGTASGKGSSETLTWGAPVLQNINQKGDSVTVTNTSTTNGVTTVTFSDGTSITIDDGDPGTSEGVVVVYASNSSGADKDFNQGDLEYVLYYEWTGTKPTNVNDISGTWVKFTGDSGASIIPIYSDRADPTSTDHLSFASGTNKFVTFFEYTGTKPTTLTAEMHQATFVPFVGASVTVTNTSTTDGVTTVTFSDGTSMTIDDGAGVKVFYSDAASGGTISTTPGDNDFIKYVEYTGDAPTTTDNTGFVRFTGDSGASIIPIYSDRADPTSTAHLSLVPGNNQYVTFFEYTGTKPTSSTLTAAMHQATYVKFIGDGEDGNNAPKVATGFVYNTSDANNPTAASYSFNPTSPGFSNLTNGWTENPPTFNSTNNIIYYARYTVTENVNSNNEPTGTGSGNNIQFGSVQTGTSFTGLVTFASNNFQSGGNNLFDITAIDGSTITTGTIKANGTAVAGSTSFTANGNAFTSAGSYINLTNGVIATRAFRVDTSGVGHFSGGISIGQTSTMSSSLTVGSGNGSVTIEGANQRIVINDGSRNRVILGKL